jgi:hypothetical protein
MVLLHFESINFSEEKAKIRGIFLRNFFFDIDKSELGKIGKYQIKDGNLEIEGKEEIVKRNFNTLLDRKLKEIKSFQGKEAIYVYKGFLPLQGSLYFGIIDRNTNIIEIRPITGCNLNCIFCSVDLCRRQRDFVVNSDYLIEEAEKLAKQKLEQFKTLRNKGISGAQKSEDSLGIEIHINAQGEPLLYAPLAELIKGLSKIKGVKTISMDTNGSLLTESKVDEIVSAGLTRFNISMNAFSVESAKRIAGIIYPIEHVKDMCKYIAKKTDILLAPVWLNGINDKDIGEIVKFSLELKKLRPNQKVPFIGIQNFLEYEKGKKPVKEKPWSEFFEFLKKLEDKYKLKLKLSRSDFGIVSAKTEKTFKKDEIVNAEIVCEGMFKHEKLCVSNNRIISVFSDKKKGRLKLKITRDKYNIFYATEI